MSYGSKRTSLRRVVTYIAGIAIFLAPLGTAASAAPNRGEAGARVASGLIPMSDGVDLSAEVLLPPKGKSFPVLLNMTPYGPATYFSQYLGDGYAHVNVDIRGTGGSGGALCIFCDREQQDVYEAVEWVAHQKWSDGNVGMFGGSYQGITPILGASKQPPHLKAILPQVTYADAYRDIVWHNGVFNANFVAQWLGAQTGLSMTGTSPSSDIPARTQQRLVTETRLQPWDSPFYRERSVDTKYDRIKVPILSVGGWFDGFSRGTLDNFRGVASKYNRLIMAPCTHKGCGAPFDPASEYAADAAPPGPKDIILAWFDHFLKGKDNGIEKAPPVTYYDIGAKEWLTDETWPPSGSHLKTFYLSGAASGSLAGASDGSLVARPVDDQDVEDHYVYDPTVGVGETFSKWGTVALSPHYRADERADEVRSLSYTTDEMDQPLSLAGPMELHFWGATTASDVDWIVKVTDVSPGGDSKLISSGYVRASHRRWDEKRSRPGRPWLPNTGPAPVPSGKALEYRIDIWDIAHTVEKGHRLRISVASSDFPNHEPLLEPAVNYLFHSGAYESKLLITVR